MRAIKPQRLPGSFTPISSAALSQRKRFTSTTSWRSALSPKPANRENCELKVKTTSSKTATWSSSVSTFDQKTVSDYSSSLRGVEDSAALFAANDFLAVPHPVRGLGGYLHVATGADFVLQADDGRIAFAGKEAF